MDTSELREECTRAGPLPMAVGESRSVLTRSSRAVLYVAEAQGSLPRGSTYCTYRRTHASLGRAVRTAHRGTTGLAELEEWMADELHGTPYIHCSNPGLADRRQVCCSHV